MLHTYTGVQKQARKFYEAFVSEVEATLPSERHSADTYATGRAILEAEPSVQIALIIEVLQWEDHSNYITRMMSDAILTRLYKRNLPYSTDTVRNIIHAMITYATGTSYLIPSQGLLRALARPLHDEVVLAACRAELEELRDRVMVKYVGTDQRKFLRLLTDILDGQVALENPVRADEWGKPLLDALAEMDEDLRVAWLAVLRHCAAASSTLPTAKWRAALPGVLAGLEPEKFVSLATQWIAALAQRKGHRLEDENSTVLKGLAWSCVGQTDVTLVAALADAAIEGYRKLPGLGPRAAMVASACIYALKNMPTLYTASQLERVRLNVKQPAYLKSIEQALNEVAQRAGMSREDLEELTVPTFQLREGTVQRLVGTAKVELALVGPHVQMQWYDAMGKARKSVPAEIKRDAKSELKEVNHLRDDIAHMLTAQRDRIERLPLNERQWRMADWRERYLDHPLVGHLASRLIWRFAFENQCVEAIWHNDQFVDASSHVLTIPSNTQVCLWHPVMSTATEIQSWRAWLEQHQIMQPFKQAYREIYLLTDAEKNTGVYSNRYAAHILKQHQFHALAIARGWHNQLRLMVDDSYNPATLDLPHWNLRAEFWIEGAGDQYEVDTNSAGTYLRLVTDQVRFYRYNATQNYAHAGGGGYHVGYQLAQAEPVSLTEIPPLVLSEVMRDVDLFVGVASIGNDPTWQDGGPESRYRRYWNEYSFGELSATATTRKQLLERLIPHLAIAERCSIGTRFLTVRGTLRTYKIHLGSGNILMEPNDQYLCIVPGQGRSYNADEVFLPFEGDAVFSIILSKAFLLAEDIKITDPTITRQLRL